MSTGQPIPPVLVLSPVPWASIPVAAYTRDGAVQPITTYLSAGPTTRSVGLQGSVNLATLIYGVGGTLDGKNVSVSIGGVAQTVAFGTPAAAADVVTACNTALASLGGIAVLSTGNGLWIRSTAGAISCSDGTVTAATIGFVSGEVHCGGMLRLRCVKDDQGTRTWALDAPCTISGLDAQIPIAHAYLKGLLYESSDVTTNRKRCDGVAWDSAHGNLAGGALHSVGSDTAAGFTPTGGTDGQPLCAVTGGANAPRSLCPTPISWATLIAGGIWAPSAKLQGAVVSLTTYLDIGAVTRTFDDATIIGAIYLECVQNWAGTWVWQIGPNSRVVAPTANRPAVDLRLVGLRYYDATLAVGYLLRQTGAGNYAWKVTGYDPRAPLAGTCSLCWPLNEAAAPFVNIGSIGTAANLSIGGGAPTTSCPGPYDSSVFFPYGTNGQYLALLGAAGNDGPNPWTARVWARPQTLAMQNSEGVVIARYGRVISAAQAWPLRIDIDAYGRVIVKTIVAGAAVTLTAPSAAVAFLSPSDWHHIVVTQNGTNMSAYCDGNLIGQIATGGITDWSDHGNWMIGYSSIEATFQYYGSVKEPLIDGAVWTQAQISADAQRGLNQWRG